MALFSKIMPMSTLCDMRLSGTWLLRSTHPRFRLLSSMGAEELGTVEDQRRQASRGWYGGCLPVETERCDLCRLRHCSDGAGAHVKNPNRHYVAFSRAKSGLFIFHQTIKFAENDDSLLARMMTEFYANRKITYDDRTTSTLIRRSCGAC